MKLIIRVSCLLLLLVGAACAQTSVLNIPQPASLTLGSAVVYPNDSLIERWRFSGDTSPTSGYVASNNTNIFESSGQGNALTWVNSPTGTNGWYSSGYSLPWSASFSGAIAYSTHLPQLDFGAGDFAIAFWINPANGWASGSTQGVIGQKSDDGAPGFQVYHDSNTDTQITLRLGDSSGNTVDVTSTEGSVVPNAWTCVVTQRVAGVGYVYTGGALNASVPNALNISGGGDGLYIGFGDTWGANYYGLLGDVRIYNRGMRGREITNFCGAHP